MFQHVYLSPHFDDASLSCGGIIHRQVQAGEPVLVVTVCASPPPAKEPLSPFAASQHEHWGNPDNAVALRQSEDQTSMKILGADYVRLDFTDCIYRGRPAQQEWYYTNNSELFGQVHPADLPLASKIAASVNQMVPCEDEVTLYAPLKVGNHVDHQLVFAAAQQLRQQGWTVVFYEDYPYVDAVFAGLDNAYSPYTLEATLNRLGEVELRPRICFFSGEDLQAKINSVAAYTSQLDALFGSLANMEKQVRDYAAQVGEGRLAERIWVPA